MVSRSGITELIRRSIALFDVVQSHKRGCLMLALPENAVDLETLLHALHAGNQRFEVFAAHNFPSGLDPPSREVLSPS
ncbi:hypothetical protein Ga0100231_024550 [Opitutaceae bacterium TAV4]|uniref:hypothetical protein n=1 Tax=Geminisphaera colitermitum TaxID=1148786 RepID=UPI0001964F4C|nr:hypothetical protein [Geminisphaera colitermitum]RRJ96928.1 hypothetical protein Ga0100231_024550 [Opitutaceae bacterium TAV4]